MTTSLYIETNYLISIATGRDPVAGILLQSPEIPLRLIIPDICYLEALSWFESELSRRNIFRDVLDKEIRQLARNITSLHAQSLKANLEASRLENRDLANDIQNRLYSAIDSLADQAELIHLLPEIIRNSLDRTIAKDPTDNLILHCIAHHIYSSSSDRKVFLSGDNGFRTIEVKAFLEELGIEKNFSRVQDF